MVLIVRYQGLDKKPLLEKYKDKKILEMDEVQFGYRHPRISKESNKPSGSIHPDYPNNFITKIKERVNSYDIIIIRYDKEIIRDLDIPFTLVYPTKDNKNYILDNILEKGFTEHVTARISGEFDKDITLIEGLHCGKVSIGVGETMIKKELTDTIDYYLKRGEITSVDN